MKKRTPEEEIQWGFDKDIHKLEEDIRLKRCHPIWGEKRILYLHKACEKRIKRRRQCTATNA